ncbi:MAG: hypothetical protein ACTH1W_03520, partial [Advenella sp.]
MSEHPFASNRTYHRGVGQSGRRQCNALQLRVLAGALLFALPVSHVYADTLDAVSRIDSVTVYPDRALVHR